MIDVLDQIKPLLTFESDDDFYYLQILQRKKENPQLGSNSRVIKNYYINSVEHLEARYDEIKGLCNLFNARASLRLNKRSYRKVAFKTMQNIANSMANGEYQFIKASYDRACGLGHNSSDKTWILDFDEGYSQEKIDEIKNDLRCIQPEGDKVVCVLPTKNGFHVITKPFNTEQFARVTDFNFDIHKDNPINLYIP